MALQVQIEKRLAGYTLSVEFSCGHEPLALLGASGAGKTMTLRSIAGLERPERGRIVMNGRVLFDSEKKIDLPSGARKIGFLFQHYALFPHLTVTDNIAFGLGHLTRWERAARVSKQIARTHLAGLESRMPRELSGGEQQRVALARAMAIEPDALLLDEPLSAMDTHLRSQIERQLMDTLAEFQRPALYVTHNMEEAYRMATNLVVLAKGRVAASGPKEEIFRHPPSREVALVTGCKNISRARSLAPATAEALDWNCRLRVAQPLAAPAQFVGIRAHHIDFRDATARGNPAEPNTFPCWLVRASQTPFRITLYLKLHEPPENPHAYDLQAEVFKEKWSRFRDLRQPWLVHLAPESVFLLAE